MLHLSQNSPFVTPLHGGGEFSGPPTAPLPSPGRGRRLAVGRSRAREPPHEAGRCAGRPERDGVRQAGRSGRAGPSSRIRPGHDQRQQEWNRLAPRMTMNWPRGMNRMCRAAWIGSWMLCMNAPPMSRSRQSSLARRTPKMRRSAARTARHRKARASPRREILSSRSRNASRQKGWPAFIAPGETRRPPRSAWSILKNTGRSRAECGLGGPLRPADVAAFRAFRDRGRALPGHGGMRRFRRRKRLAAPALAAPTGRRSAPRRRSR